MIRFNPIVILACCLLFPKVSAQDVKVIDVSVARVNYLTGLFGESVQSDGRYINGSVYQDFYSRANGHPFFLTKNWYDGSVAMNGKRYDTLSLRYDVYTDQLILNHIHETGVFALKLNKTRIDSFFIDGYSFCQIHADTGLHQAVEPGFYEVICTGRASFYQKWQKRYNEPSQNSSGEFLQFNELYILNQSTFHKIKRKPQLVKALKDRGKEIKAYLKEQHIFIGSGDVGNIKQVVDYYNNLQQ